MLVFHLVRLANGDSMIIRGYRIGFIRFRGTRPELRVNTGVNHDFRTIKLRKLSNVYRETHLELAIIREPCYAMYVSPPIPLPCSYLDTIMLLAAGRELIIKR